MTRDKSQGDKNAETWRTQRTEKMVSLKQCTSGWDLNPAKTLTGL